MYNYSYTLTSNDISDAVLAGGVSGMIVSFFTTYFILIIAIWVLTIVANWRIFTKAGEKGWKSIIPIYNTVVLFRIIGISSWWVLGYFAVVIPVVGYIFVFGLTIYAMMKLAKAFGKGAGFTVGLILLNTIFVLILGLGSAEYQLEKNTKDAEVIQ